VADVRAAFVAAHKKQAAKLLELETKLKTAPKSAIEEMEKDIAQEVTHSLPTRQRARRR